MHIDGVCSKARKILGLLYRRYYQHADSNSLRQLYLSLVRPHLDYAAQVWDPHLQKDINTLESVQKFGLKLCSKQWDTGYHELLEMFKFLLHQPFCRTNTFYHSFIPGSIQCYRARDWILKLDHFLENEVGKVDVPSVGYQNEAKSMLSIDVQCHLTLSARDQFYGFQQISCRKQNTPLFG